MISLGVDVGGTFTDFVAFNPEEEAFTVFKLPSTPENPMLAMIDGMDQMGLSLNQIQVFAHGTTVTTNAVIQKTGSKTGLITTKGFRDILQLRRTNRADVYNLQWTPPPELVPRRFRRDVEERVNAEGKILKPLDQDELRFVINELIHEGVESLAVTFINSYVNPENERKAKELIHSEFPEIAVCISFDILPEWREFERTSSTVVNAYLIPVLNSYLKKLDQHMTEHGYVNEIFVMLSNGGLSTSKVAREIPAYTLASGPSGGVIAEREIGRISGESNIVGLDMGGTSADVSLVLEDEVTLQSEQQIEFGTIIRLPGIKIISIGAGGGSIAWLDEIGGLHVGPRSAGAKPGPVCYGMGGTEPTVTDANMVLGRLNPRYLLAGAMKVHPEKSRQLITQKIANPLNMPLETAAWGILEIVNHNMINAIREVTIQRGIDPREFTLFAYGGAGPLHATQIAQELGMRRVIVPSHPGVTSAMGLLMTDIRHDFCKTFLRVLQETKYKILDLEFSKLEKRGLNRLEREGISPPNIKLVRGMDLRYLGQTHELTVNLAQLDKSAGGEIKSYIAHVFCQRHEQEYGFSRDITFPIEVVNIRLTAFGLLPKIDIREKKVDRPKDWMEFEVRPVFFNREQGFRDTPIFNRNHLPVNKALIGPAIIEQLDSTTVIFPEQRVILEPNGNLIIDLNHQSQDKT